MKTGTIVVGVVVALLVLLAVLVRFQNAEVLTQITLNLGLAAWRTRPVPVVDVLLVAIVASALLSGVPLALRDASARRRVQELERRLQASTGNAWR